MNGYPYCVYFGGVSICYGGREDMGVCCNMSGKGCRTFETCGSGDYKAIFDVILENYSDDADKRQMNLTRLDVAYDDFEGVLDIWTIFKAVTSNGYVDNGKRRYWVETVSSSDRQKTRSKTFPGIAAAMAFQWTLACEYLGY